MNIKQYQSYNWNLRFKYNSINLRRKFIGIEKNSEMFEIAKVRIKKQEFERIKEEDATK